MPELGSILDSLCHKNVLLIGDFILDVHHRGKAVGISGEAPVIVALDEGTDVSFGGAALVASNILALGGRVTFVFRGGEDEYAGYASRFAHQNLRARIFRDPGDKTVVKERFVVNGQKVLRWDRFATVPLSSESERSILSFVEENLEQYDKLVVSDYRHGLLTERLASSLVSLARSRKKPIYVDSQIRRDIGNHAWYRGASLICFNLKEALTICPGFDENFSEKSLRAMHEGMGGSDIIVKLGPRGSMGLIGGNHISAEPFCVEAIDAVGAGDAYVAALAVLDDEISESELRVANIWAALSTTISGTEPPTMAMLRKAIHGIQE